MGNSFLNAFMPTLPWWLLVAGLLTGWAFIARAWVNRWKAQKLQVERPRKALCRARDALASVISDPLAREETRKQALSAYESVADALNKEIGH